MKPEPPAARLAVCSWSLHPASPGELVDKLGVIGVRRVQLALDPLRKSPDVWGNTPEIFSAAGISIVSGMIGFVGEDYTTMESIERTGGVAPDETWDENWRDIQASAAIAAKLGIDLVTFHAGFIPPDVSSPAFRKMRDRLSRTSDAFQERGVAVAFETGQETAEVLATFLQKLDRPNTGINFDPANMILYARGNPVEAVRTLGPWIRQVHIKDAKQTQVPGTWGDEVCAGTGEVDWPSFFAALNHVGFTGNFCIEREAGSKRLEDIRAARALVESIAAS